MLGAMCAMVTDHELMRRSTMVMTELPGCYSGYPGHILVLIRVIDIRCPASPQQTQLSLDGSHFPLVAPATNHRENE